MEYAKVGLALGAGSTKGFAHIGVLQVLEENHIPIDLVAGSSIGAIVGGIYAAGTDLRLLERFALQLNLREYLDVGRPRSGGLLRGGGSAPLLCLAHYGAALLLLPLRCAGNDDVQPVPEAEAGACAGGALRMVGDGMAAMVQIGGCIAGAGTVQPPENSRRLLEHNKAQAPKSNPVESDYTEYLQIIREDEENWDPVARH